MSIKAKSIFWEVDNKRIIEDISLEISRGEVVSIIGPN